MMLVDDDPCDWKIREDSLHAVGDKGIEEVLDIVIRQLIRGMNDGDTNECLLFDTAQEEGRVLSRADSVEGTFQENGKCLRKHVLIDKNGGKFG